MAMPQLPQQQQQLPAFKRARVEVDHDACAWLHSFQLDRPCRPAAEDQHVACWRPEALQPAWTGVRSRAAGWASRVQLPDLRAFVRDSCGEG